ncbi:MAG: DNA polymerase III subunit beta [Clostridiales bacterium]|nr:DNA polymerase III subunit beta [Clostridiales bacterium]MCF8021513.1 DNA polymerase III subunit beta [Clostridiales bacterium]
MNFTVATEKLLTALQTVSGMVSSRAPLPILSGIFFQIENNSLYITATDMNQGILTSIPVNVKYPGKAVLPAKQVIELLRRLPDIEIEVENNSENNITTIKYMNSELNLHGFPPDEYPMLPDLTEENSISVSQNLFKKMLKQVLHAVAIEEHRPIFTGVLLEIMENKLTLVATDTHRLSLRTTTLEYNFESIINAVVPGKTLNELVKLLNKEESKINIYITENQIFFLLENIKIVSRLLKGNFPNYKIAIPENIASEIKLNKSEFLNAVDRALLLSNPTMQKVNIHAQNNILNIYLNSDKGAIREDINIVNSGKDLKVGFNGRYLKDALKSMENEEIYFQLTGPTTPALLKPIDSNEYLSLLVPATDQFYEGNE